MPLARLPFARLTAVALLTAAPSALAETAPPELGSSLVQLVGGLAIVVALLLGSLMLIKRLSSPRGAAAGLKVLGAASVGPRERVVLVELADQVLVLGVTPSSVNTLHTLPLDTFRACSPTLSQTPPDFQGWLAKALERRKGH